MITGNARSGLAIVVGLKITLVAAMLVSCASMEALDDMLVSDYRASLAQEIDCSGSAGLRRARYDAVYFLVQKFAFARRADIETESLLRELQQLDINDPGDSIEVERIARIILKGLDPDISTVENEFITRELPERIEWIYYHGAWYCDNPANPFDDLGSDVLCFGIPELDHWDSLNIEVTFWLPTGSLSLSYLRPKQGLGQYRRRLPYQQRVTAVRETHNYQMVYVETEFAQLEDMAAEFLPFPCRPSGSWDCVSKYGAAPWTAVAARFDICGKLGDLVSQVSETEKRLDLRLQYSIVRARDNSLIDSDSILLNHSVIKGDENDAFRKKLYCSTFHEFAAIDTAAGETDYLVNLYATHGDRQFRRSWRVTLPNHTGTWPAYWIALTDPADSLGQQRQCDPFSGIARSLPIDVLHKGDVIYPWLPLTNLPELGEQYACTVELLLVPKRSWKGVTEILGDDIIVWWSGEDTLTVNQPKPAKAVADPHAIAFDTIYSDTPNHYHQVRDGVIVPRSVERGQSYLIAFVRSYGDQDAPPRLLGTAIKEVAIE
jgi:hypothetical protein